MDILNPIDSASFLNHFAHPSLEKDIDEAVRTSRRNETRRESKQLAPLGFTRAVWIQSWAVAPV